MEESVRNINCCTVSCLMQNSERWGGEARRDGAKLEASSVSFFQDVAETRFIDKRLSSLSMSKRESRGITTQSRSGALRSRINRNPLFLFVRVYTIKSSREQNFKSRAASIRYRHCFASRVGNSIRPFSAHRCFQEIRYVRRAGCINLSSWDT